MDPLDPYSSDWLPLVVMVAVSLFCLGCAGVGIYFFYVLMAKLVGAFLGALVGAFVSGYHLFVH